MSEKIGLFVCNCGENISSRLDTQKLESTCKSITGVSHSQMHNLWCSKEGCEQMQKVITDKGLSHVVVAACSPKQHQSTFSKVMENAGLNPYLMQMANIREQVAWVTPDKQQALEKAIKVTTAAINRVKHQEPLHKTELSCNADVLVIGAGIAGMSAALKLAQKDRHVCLVEKKPWIGGKVATFEDVFPANECAPCMLEPIIDKVLNHEQITVYTQAEVKEVRGFFGNFDIKIEQKPRYIDAEKCYGCSECFKDCPVTKPNPYNGGLGKIHAIYNAYPGSMPNVPVIDSENCLRFKNENCNSCIEACHFDAINFNQTEKLIELKTGAVIIATGYELYDTQKIDHFESDNDSVLNAYQFERLLSKTGPTEGEIQDKNDKKINSIAFIHCAGSRDKDHVEYCSGICCSLMLKQAQKASQKLKNAQVYEFHSDICLSGKYAQKLLQNNGENKVNFLRQEDHRKINVSAKNGQLEIRSKLKDGQEKQLLTDKVILATAMIPGKDTKTLANLFGLEIDDYGFFRNESEMLSPASTRIRGIYTVGCSTGPKNIPESVLQAQAAASEILSSLNLGEMLEMESCTCQIDEAHCSTCHTCIPLCPFKAISFDPDKNSAVINQALCRGCGICASACPSGVIHNKHYSSRQIEAEIEGILS